MHTTSGLRVGLPTPHNVLTVGLPGVLNGLPILETVGQAFRRGQETCAERARDLA